MQKLAIALLIPILCWGQQNPTQAQYLASRASDISTGYASIANLPLPKPAFGAQVVSINNQWCCTQFSAGQASNQVLQLQALGIDRVSVNISPVPYLNNDSTSMTYINTVLTQISGLGLKLIFDPAVWSSGIAAACGGITQPSDLDTCMTTSHAWLGNKGVYQYLAATYTPYEFIVLHEPSTANSNLGISGTVNQWATFVADMAAIVVAASGTTKCGYALDWLEQSYNVTFATQANISFAGYDIYVTDSTNLGLVSTMMAGALARGLYVIVAEMWVEVWAPAAASPPTDGNAYEGVGNCDYGLVYDQTRQQITFLSLWSAAQGASEILYFNVAFTGTYCAMAGVSTSLDRITSGGYVANVAAAAGNNLKTKVWYDIQHIIQWWPTFVSGMPLN